MKNKCRLCGSQDNSIAFISQNYHGRHLLSKHKFKILKCHNCSNYYLANIEKKAKYYKKFYRKNYYANPNFLSNILEYLSYHYKIKLINRFFKNKKIRLLDIGCGRGEFIDMLPPNIQATGIDINPNIKHKNIILEDFNKHFFSENSFDCITMWHVFEHLNNPQITISNIYHILTPGGLLIFDTPNSSSLGFIIGKKYFFHLDSPRHLFIPNSQNIRNLLNKNNFDNIKISKNIFDYPLDLFWSVRKSLLQIIIYPLYPLIKILNSSLISVTAQKNE